MKLSRRQSLQPKNDGFWFLSYKGENALSQHDATQSLQKIYLTYKLRQVGTNRYVRKYDNFVVLCICKSLD